MIPCLAAELKFTLWQNTFQQPSSKKMLTSYEISLYLFGIFGFFTQGILKVFSTRSQNPYDGKYALKLVSVAKRSFAADTCPERSEGSPR